ncbi:hypothetical protein HMPREF1870_02219 [Bacteroidales bacterium KA00344]|nr:hypothetical protein HMPREF1870_02219 [Bacteroidales bacterium KA00344]
MLPEVLGAYFKQIYKEIPIFEYLLVLSDVAFPCFRFFAM